MMPYIIHVAIVLTGCFLFYKFLLQKETFYRVNRYFLLLSIFISFSLPMLRVPEQWSFRKAEEPVLFTPILITDETQSQQTDSEQSAGRLPGNNADSVTSGFTFKGITQWLFYLYWFGVLAFAFNFLLQLIVLFYRIKSNPVIVDGRYRIIEISGDKPPCSFGNYIFINPEKYDWDTYSQILEHEKVHIQHRHTVDILIAELALIFQWFNPFAWQYRKEVETNLEYFTDDQLVQNERVEKGAYQVSLLKVATPHFPLSLTTNYNQSLLKKRIVMMNTKRSEVHTAWKYFFILPLLVLFTCLLNEPMANAQDKTATKEKNKEYKEEEKIARKMEHGIDTEGYWFATIKDDRISIQFKNDEDDEHSVNGNSFPLSDFPNLPRGNSGTFRLTREAGTMEFTGKFEGDQGMGRYRFTGDRQYGSSIGREIDEELSEKDLLVFFMINIKRSHLQMLEKMGYDGIRKNDLIPVVALGINESFIRSIKESGYDEVSLHDLIPLKAMHIDGDYIREIRSAYPSIGVQQLIAFKAQGIDKNYIEKVRREKVNKEGEEEDAQGNKNKNKNKNKQKDNDEAQEIISMKAMHVDEDYINSFRSVGLTNISNHDLIAMKSMGVTPEYVKGFHAIGYKDIKPSDLLPLKGQSITPEFITSFEDAGFKNLPLQKVIAVKALGITPSYINSMKEKGFNYKDISKYIQLKSIDRVD